MSTSDLIDAVLKKVPQADPSMILELTVSCDADLNRVFALLGIQSASKKRQMTFDTRTTDKPAKVTKTSSDLVPLYSSEQVDNANICCTLHQNFLDPSLANQLALTLNEEAKDWKYRKFHLFEREVQSGHSNAIYSSDDAIISGEKRMMYQGMPISHLHPMSPEMARASQQVQEFVRQFSPNWCSQVCVTNRYAGRGEKLDYHSDQLTNLGPKPIIAALSLGCSREFRIKDRRVPPRRPTYSIRIPHNSLLIMHPGCQEQFKHCVPPVSNLDPDPLLGTVRISLTFRHYKSNVSPPKCRCNEPMLMRTTLPDPAGKYKYIWQCSQHYVGKMGCNETKVYDSLTNTK